MRIVCPSCQATYEVPDAILASGPRAVRCARCATEWTPGPPPEPDVAAAPEPPVPPPPPNPPQPEAAAPITAPRIAEPRVPLHLPPEQPDKPGPALWVAIVAWALSLAVLGAAGWAAVSYRSDIMTAWPPSERVYTALGLIS